MRYFYVCRVHKKTGRPLDLLMNKIHGGRTYHTSYKKCKQALAMRKRSYKDPRAYDWVVIEHEP
eukprot:4345738-Karenia_brevis.AAC.1